MSYYSRIKREDPDGAVSLSSKALKMPQRKDDDKLSDQSRSAKRNVDKALPIVTDQEDEDIKPKIEQWDDEELIAIRSKLRILRNDRMKLKKGEDEGELWPTRIISGLVDTLPHFHVENSDLDIDFAVERRFLSRTFGGNSQKQYPGLAKKMLDELIEQGFDDCPWMCLNAGYNPLLPSKPGKPGLLFESGDADKIERKERKKKAGAGSKMNRVFARLAPNEWIYVGRYDVTFTTYLSAQEWHDLDPKVKNSWADGVCELDWGKKQRARIILRNRPGANRQFTREEFEALSRGKDELLGKVTKEQALETFDLGEEFILVYSMECVGYEHGFQRKIIDEYPDWKAKDLLRPKKSKKGTKKENKKHTQGVTDDSLDESRARKRRKQGSRELEDGRYILRGTRSRPITSSSRS